MLLLFKSDAAVIKWFQSCLEVGIFILISDLAFITKWHRSHFKNSGLGHIKNKTRSY